MSNPAYKQCGRCTSVRPFNPDSGSPYRCRRCQHIIHQKRSAAARRSAATRAAQAEERKTEELTQEEQIRRFAQAEERRKELDAKRRAKARKQAAHADTASAIRAGRSHRFPSFTKPEDEVIAEAEERYQEASKALAANTAAALGRA